MTTPATLTTRLARLSSAIDQVAAASTAGDYPVTFTPNAGPQTDALHTPADETFYGGSAGSGKSFLLLGLAFTQHRRSMIYRRHYDELEELIDKSVELVGTRKYFNGSNHRWTLPGGRVVRFAAVQHLDDWRKYMGRSYDLIAFDEVSNFLEAQYLNLTGWARTTIPGQRVRVVATGNPPTSAEGEWVIRRWAPWLDATHPYPAEPGELRYFARLDGADTEVDGPQPFDFTTKDGTVETVYPKSRTFIPARLTDNPFLMHDMGYVAQLQSKPEPLRSQLLYGDFSIGLGDMPWQVIPAAWMRAAFDRWEACRPEASLPVSALGVDVAEGGQDHTVLAPRYGLWLDRLRVYPGAEFRDETDAGGASDIPAMVLKALIERVLIEGHNLDADVLIDVIGHGTGGGCYALLREAGRRVWPVRGDDPCEVVADGNLRFVNLRSWLYWNVRMHLDPAGPEQTRLALPPDQRLLADLTAPTYSSQTSGIKVESKRDIKKRLGRSTDYSDAVVYACMPTMPRHTETTRAIVMGHSSAGAGRVRGHDGRMVRPESTPAPGYGDPRSEGWIGVPGITVR